MATGLCLNDECDRDEWSLRKHPTQYSRGGPSCPDCGTTRVETEADGPAPHQQPANGAMAGGQRQGGQQGAQAPQVAATQQQGQPPATQGTAGLPAAEDAMSAGMSAADMLAGVRSNDPETRGAATGRLLKTLGAAAAQYGDHVEAEQRQRRQRARKETGGSIRQTGDQYHTCPACDAALTNVPAGEFRCPNCHEPLEHVPGGD